MLEGLFSQLDACNVSVGASGVIFSRWEIHLLGLKSGPERPGEATFHVQNYFRVFMVVIRMQTNCPPSCPDPFRGAPLLVCPKPAAGLAPFARQRKSSFPQAFARESRRGHPKEKKRCHRRHACTVGPLTKIGLLLARVPRDLKVELHK